MKYYLKILKHILENSILSKVHKTKQFLCVHIVFEILLKTCVYDHKHMHFNQTQFILSDLKCKIQV